MGLQWSGMYEEVGNTDDRRRTEIQGYLDQIGDHVEQLLRAQGLPRSESPLFQPFSMAVIEGDDFLEIGLAEVSGSHREFGFFTVAGLRLDHPKRSEVLQEAVEVRHLVLTSTLLVRLTDGPDLLPTLARVAQEHVTGLTSELVLRPLGDLTGYQHLEPHLRDFMSQHPDYSSNVFVMMPFRDDEQMTAVWSALRTSLASHGLSAHRADDRNYTDDLWSNIVIYALGCSLGVALFEQVEQQNNFNPNVALELGFMMGRGKRTMLLKEQRLQSLPSDVAHRLYRPFDIFHIEATISREVARWVVDLGRAAGPGMS